MNLEKINILENPTNIKLINSDWKKSLKELESFLNLISQINFLQLSNFTQGAKDETFKLWAFKGKKLIDEMFFHNLIDELLFDEIISYEEWALIYILHNLDITNSEDLKRLYVYVNLNFA